MFKQMGLPLKTFPEHFTYQQFSWKPSFVQWVSLAPLRGCCGRWQERWHPWRSFLQGSPGPRGQVVRRGGCLWRGGEVDPRPRLPGQSQGSPHLLRAGHGRVHGGGQQADSTPGTARATVAPELCALSALYVGPRCSPPAPDGQAWAIPRVQEASVKRST